MHAKQVQSPAGALLPLVWSGGASTKVVHNGTPRSPDAWSTSSPHTRAPRPTSNKLFQVLHALPNLVRRRKELAWMFSSIYEAARTTLTRRAIVTPFSSNAGLISAASSRPGYMAKREEKKQFDRYPSINLVPFVLETTGRLGYPPTAIQTTLHNSISKHQLRAVTTWPPRLLSHHGWHPLMSVPACLSPIHKGTQPLCSLRSLLCLTSDGNVTSGMCPHASWLHDWQSPPRWLSSQWWDRHDQSVLWPTRVLTLDAYREHPLQVRTRDASTQYLPSDCTQDASTQCPELRAEQLTQGAVVAHPSPQCAPQDYGSQDDPQPQNSPSPADIPLPANPQLTVCVT